MGSSSSDRATSDSEMGSPSSDMGNSRSGSGTSSAARMAAGVVGCLLLTMLLVSGKLVEIAERQPLGESRDRWLDLAEGVDRTANFLALNRPYDLITDIRGVGTDAGEKVDTVLQVVEAFEAERVSNSRSDSSWPPAPVDKEALIGGELGVACSNGWMVTSDNPLRVHVLGDSQAAPLGHTLGAASNGLFEVTTNSRNSTSFARPDYFNWHAELQEIAAKDNPDLVVMFIGASDWQSMEARNGQIVESGTPEWIDEWAWRLNVAFDLITADHRVIVWVGLPPMRSRDDNSAALVMNEVVAQVATDRPGVAMLDIWEMFGDDYSEKVSPPSGGDPVRVRADDGIHLNRTGSAWVSAGVVETVAGTRDDAANAAREEGAMCWGVGRAIGGSRLVSTDEADQLAEGSEVPLNSRNGDRRHPLFMPEGDFVSVSASWNQVCALRAADRGVTCWGDNLDGRDQVPEGAFRRVATGAWHACGIRPSDEVECWGTEVSGMSEDPVGQYESISVGARHSCAIRPDQSIFCWGNDDHGRTAAPDADYAMVSAGGWHSCGILADMSVLCWGDNSLSQTEAPSGNFISVQAGGFHSCALRESGDAVCWGDDLFGQAEAPSGTFVSVVTGQRHSCALREDGQAVCWGNNDHGRADPPGGVFVSLDAGGNLWQLHTYLPSPDNVSLLVGKMLP